MNRSKSSELYDRAVIHTTVPRLSMAMRPQKRSTLDENNAKWSSQNKQLHPTKGWRKISVKRTLIADMTARKMWGNLPLMKGVLQRRVFI